MPLLAEPDDTLVNEAWAAVNAVALTIPKETQPAFVRVLRVCFSGTWFVNTAPDAAALVVTQFAAAR